MTLTEVDIGLGVYAICGGDKAMARAVLAVLIDERSLDAASQEHGVKRSTLAYSVNRFKTVARSYAECEEHPIRFQVRQREDETIE